ncbi:MAG: DEAD/DEAH box helicase family protein [Caldilineaceae bacterium]|nr:DEAD/DEAH box helicase family protein [Caldilineaceae bacterium]
MQATNTRDIISEALDITNEMNPQATDGTWLEDLTVQVGPYLKEWDIDRCYPWDEWPEREDHFPKTTKQDVGIDAVAVRLEDNQFIAIQCKARQLDEHGNGAPIEKGETDKFASASSDDFWAERWIVTNGNCPLSNNALQVLSMTSKPVKLVNVTNDLLDQQTAPIEEECPHCAPNPGSEPRRQTKSCMQAEAIAESIRILRDHERSQSGGSPAGHARGKIILPCGTGKTRISLRIIEKLTQPGELSIVLCPSIALVAQIRREYLQYATTRLRALAVCSDVTAGYDPRKEGTRDTTSDPTLDNSNVSASVVKGMVTTDPSEIAEWIRDGKNAKRINVIFGTYQSGRPIADALQEVGVTAQVLVADEAHRTAGLRRKKSAKSAVLSPDEQRVRDFTLCHDNDAMPATYRVYQTATPRVYDTTKVKLSQNSDWVVRSMDDEEVFGVELYRKSYVEAVNNGWLADYRIIAVGVNGADVYDVAYRLAQDTESKGRNRLTTPHFLRGLAFALAMGGATWSEESGTVPIKSCIAFMNTVDKSKNMTKDLQEPFVKEWLQDWLTEFGSGREAADYALEHLDATSNVSSRENAKRRLAAATDAQPHGIINVGIFGEGTDSPSLSAVAFLEPRKSPIDVIQAVGRAMRTAEGKEMGYIICPIVFPANGDAEAWLSNSSPEEGWQELGQILLALRAHDQRIEENLSGLLQLYLPKVPEKVHTFIGIAKGESKRVQYWMHEGAPGNAQEDVENVLKGASPRASKFVPLPVSEAFEPPVPDTKDPDGFTSLQKQKAAYVTAEPTLIITGKVNGDGSFDMRTDTVVRNKPDAAGRPGKLNIRRTKRRAKEMINNGGGNPLPSMAEKKKKREKGEQKVIQRQMRLLREMEEFGEAICMNLLEKSGLTSDRVLRDLNILEDSIREAAHHLNADELRPDLDRHFGLDNLKESELNKQADGCTIAALLMMNAAMLHQRIANGRWLSGVSDLEAVKNDVNVVRRVNREWNQIMRHDFRPVLEPAVNAIQAVEDTGKLAGLERALRHIAAEAERIAESYADMGADHAGPLFNRVMGNQASDGAFFTRPVAASIVARLTLDACGEQDWIDPAVWREFKTVDLACGSGTLLAAMLTDMKRRAQELGAGTDRLVELQKLGVEETIKGLDINPVSLQLAASQLTTGNQEIRYRSMGLHLMPYGPHPDDSRRISVGTLELLGQKAIIPRNSELGLADDKIGSRLTWGPSDDTELEDAVSAVKDVRIVIMNPPFTNRAKMGEKFPKETQQKMRSRADAMEGFLVGTDPDLMEFSDKNSIGPLFVALADHIQKRPDGVVSMINPTIALSSTSGLKERQILAQRFHIHTVLTCHQPGQINLSQQTSINESIVVMRRHPNGPKPPTRFIHLDRMPVDEGEVEDLHRCLQECDLGQMSNGWGEISEWPAGRMENGDWSPAIWRAPELAEAATRYANHPDLQAINMVPGLSVHATGRVLRGSFERAVHGTPGSFPILKSKGSEGQQAIQSKPDEYWIPKKRDESQRQRNGGSYPEADKILDKAGYLLLTAGQRNSTSRLTATADNGKFVGNGWMPVTGVSPAEAQTLAVFLNSTVGRLQLMRNPGRTIEFPIYSAAEASNLKIPNIKDARVRKTLTDCWEHTKEMEVPQFRDGECEVRTLWDTAVAEAMDWDKEQLDRLRDLLSNEPHVRGLGYNQYADEIEDIEGLEAYLDDKTAGED